MQQAAALQMNGVSSGVTMSTTAGATPPLNAGVYAFWAVTQNGYIGPAPSTALTASNGYPIIGGAAPVLLYAAQNQQIGLVSSSSGILNWQKVG